MPHYKYTGSFVRQLPSRLGSKMLHPGDIFEDSDKDEHGNQKRHWERRRCFELVKDKDAKPAPDRRKGLLTPAEFSMLQWNDARGYVADKDLALTYGTRKELNAAYRNAVGG